MAGQIQNTGHTNANHNANLRQAVRDGVDAAAGPTGGRDRNGQALIQNPSHRARPWLPAPAASSFGCCSVSDGGLPIRGAGTGVFACRETSCRFISRNRLASKSSHEGPSRFASWCMMNWGTMVPPAMSGGSIGGFLTHHSLTLARRLAWGRRGCLSSWMARTLLWLR